MKASPQNQLTALRGARVLAGVSASGMVRKYLHGLCAECYRHQVLSTHTLRGPETQLWSIVSKVSVSGIRI